MASGSCGLRKKDVVVSSVGTQLVLNASRLALIVCTLLSVYVSAGPLNVRRRSVNFVDTRQGDFVNTLDNYEISVPVKVTADGEHLSHSVNHRVPPLTSTVDDPSSPAASHLRRRRRRSVTAEQDAVHYRVNVDGQDLHLALEANHGLFGPGLVVERRHGGYKNLTDVSRLYSIEDHDRCHFSGHVRGLNGSKVAVSTCNGLHGFIHTGFEQYFIEPVRGHDGSVASENGESGAGHPHLIYKRSALPPGQHIWSVEHHEQHHEDEEKDQVQEVEDEVCGVTGDDAADAERLRQDENGKWMSRSSRSSSSGSRGRRRRERRSVSLERNVETLVVVDRSMMEYYKNEDVETYVLTIMNMVSTMYHDATIGNAINVVLVRIIYLEQDEPNLKIGHHADNTLASFCQWQMSMNPKDEAHANHHDVAILLTRVNICSRMNEPCSTLGLSQVSGMCQPHRSCNINEDTGLALAFTVAHELGHNFGMQHDTPENGCEARPGEEQHVMSPQMTAEASPLIWSECSRRAITHFLDRDWGYCLDDEPSEHQFKFPVLPPGVMYDIDHQCRLQYGPEAEFCEGIDDPCTTVWCRVEKKCLTRLEAAAAGTLCGNDDSGAQQWCFAGRCSTLGEKPQSIDGQWASWGEWSECSRTCGAGVSQSERHCNNPQPTHGGRYCLGERKRYRICNTDACPEGAPGFRELQCAEFNNQPVKGHRYTFEPILAAEAPCQLHCLPKGRKYSMLLRDMVADGTPCRPGRRDMCISGRCRVIGCDWGIESDAREDQCGICHGDGTTCTTIKQNFDTESGLGYVEATIIPEGARNIRVEEVAEANNYLAIRNEHGQYYLNGHWYIQWSGDYEAAGTVIHYRRDGNRESFNAPGPIKEPLHIMLLFQSQNPGVELEYTVPLENITEKRRPEFLWKYAEWTHCAVSCGGGSQISKVICVEKEADRVELDEVYCNASTKPDDMHKACNAHQCPARWWTGPWQHCSVTCGDQGIHKRTVLCVRQLGSDQQIALEDWECEDLERPTDISPCRRKEPCPPEYGQWRTGPWSNICETDPCGMQNRHVMCSDPTGHCDPDEMPLVERRCSNATCGTWKTGDWSMCTRSCDGGIQFRSVSCVGRACAAEDKPSDEQQCNVESCLSVTKSLAVEGRDGSGVEARKSSSMPTATPAAAQNQTTASPEDKAGEAEVTDDKIQSSTTTTTTTATATTTTAVSGTTTTTTPSPFQSSSTADSTPSLPGTTTTKKPTVYRYMALFWDSCSRMCGGGSRRRRVRCINMDTKDTVIDDFCSSQQKPAEQEDCNTDPCLSWTTSPWLECSTTCGEGLQLRNVSCPVEGMCHVDEKPTDKQLCDAGPCLQWKADDWQKCSRSCDGGMQKRVVQCINTVTQQEASGCDVLQQPLAVSDCNTQKCVATDDTNIAAVSGLPQCPPEGDTMNTEMCKVLLRMGKCRLEYIQRKCCQTCSSAAGERTPRRT